ncbi:uncharacterized protein PRCAT00005283001 [Priceomyces carsonii]|uniref:uncharacterized protein n=1 Tax=Priceomyces carsonii TaxID=28549 RepID=UPI002EDB15E1|nr:unnamed protein product [Priceomyces carsonii]
MPLDLPMYPNEEAPDPSHFYYQLEDLRVSIIGNEDLKLKLAGDTSFMEDLVTRFHKDLERLEKYDQLNGEPQHELLVSLEKEVIILKILCSFVTEMNSVQHPNVANCIDCFEELMGPIVRLLNYFIVKVIPKIYDGTSEGNNNEKIENSVQYCLDILNSLFSAIGDSRRFAPEKFKKLWRLIISLVIINDDSQAFYSILVKLLELVPLLLENSNLDDTLVVTLLSTLLKRLSSECSIICETHFPEAMQSQDALFKAAFQESSLPNVEPIKSIMKTKVNMPFLLSLITCVAQIFSFLKYHDYDILMSSSIGLPLKGNSLVMLPVNIYISLLLLLKCESKMLRLVTLNLLGFYLNNLKVSREVDGFNEEVIFRNFKKLFPRIIELLDLEENSMSFELPAFLLSPTQILANLCTRYPLLNDDIRRANLDIRILKALELSFKSNQTIKVIRSLRKDTENCNKLADFSAVLTSRKDSQDISDLLLLLSVYTSYNEDYRHRVTDSMDPKTTSNLALEQIIFEIIDDYSFLMDQMLAMYKSLRLHLKSSRLSESQITWFNKNLGIVMALINSSLFTNCLYLIRSVSRSVSTLRTFFVECNSLVADPLGVESPRPSKGLSGAFIRNFLYILKNSEVTIKIFDFFYKLSSSSHRLKKSQITNMSLTLGIIANFILAFSSFRYEIINDGEFLKDLSQIYQRFANVEDTSPLSDESDLYRRNIIRLNILHVLKNFIFNENIETKKEINEAVPLSLLFERASYPLCGYTDELIQIKSLKMQQKIVAFDIFRNYTAGSSKFNKIIVDHYENVFSEGHTIPSSWEDFLIANIKNLTPFSSSDTNVNFEDNDDLLNLILDDNYVNMVTSINYIENHKYTNIDLLNKKYFPQKELLLIWLRFLKLKVSSEFEGKLRLDSKVSLNNNLNEIKTSIIWVLINLTHQNDTLEYQGSEGNHYNLFDTVDDTSRNSGKIDIDDSDESDSNSTENYLFKSNKDSLTVAERALYLRKLGFLSVITGLIDNISRGSYVVSHSKTSKRFDLENSYDLLEKAKTASFQLSGSRRRHTTGGDNNRPSLRTAARRVFGLGRPDVNRGGEGYGYGSDDDYANANQSLQSMPVRPQDYNVDDHEDEEVDDDEADDDDYWIH